MKKFERESRKLLNPKMLVILLLIDGLGYEYLKPDSFWSQHSVRIRNADPTITAPNWATILSGLSPQKHGVLDNKLHALPSYRFPYSTVFDDVVAPGRSLMISDWKMMRKFSDRCDFEYNRVWSRVLQNIDRYAQEYDFIVINYSRLDNVAHSLHWGSVAYQQTLSYIDQQTRKLYDKLRKLGIPFTLLGTADHGGEKDDHEEGHLTQVHSVPLLYVSDSKKVPKKLGSTAEIRGLIRTLLSKKK
jgi:hypothetical protein